MFLILICCNNYRIVGRLFSWMELRKVSPKAGLQGKVWDGKSNMSIIFRVICLHLLVSQTNKTPPATQNTVISFFSPRNNPLITLLFVRVHLGSNGAEGRRFYTKIFSSEGARVSLMSVSESYVFNYNFNFYITTLQASAFVQLINS